MVKLCNAIVTVFTSHGLIEKVGTNSDRFKEKPGVRIIALAQDFNVCLRFLSAFLLVYRFILRLFFSIPTS
ncbi:MAG: hypothetical protein ACO3EZ_08225 [Prochlorotrichaceae cyanobacterium]